MGSCDVRNLTRQPLSGLPFVRVAHALLPRWNISLVFVGVRRAARLNRTLRGKVYIPNVLSYALGTKHGEIIICPAVAKKQARTYGLPQRTFLLFLFIHGLLHLKGYRHGTTMERYERKILARFASTSARLNHDTTNRNRH